MCKLYAKHVLYQQKFIKHVCIYVYALVYFPWSPGLNTRAHLISECHVSGTQLTCIKATKALLVLITIVVTGRSTRLRSLKTHVLSLTLPLTGHLPLAKSRNLCPQLSSLRYKDRCIERYEQSSPFQAWSVMILWLCEEHMSLNCKAAIRERLEAQN